MQRLKTATAVLALAAAPALAQDKAAVLTTYADIAQAGYTDSLTSALALKAAVDALIDDPSDATMAAAHAAWIAARDFPGGSSCPSTVTVPSSAV